MGKRNPINRPKVSIVIPVMNERRTLARVIRNASNIHPSAEIIVVINGSTDGSDQIARHMGTRVISFKKALGHDVGRSIGARKARGDIILFMDGDIVIPASKLRTFIRAVEQGADVALNKYLGATRRKHLHSVELSKRALNTVLFRPDLRSASMTTIPHALSRKALKSIGAENLSVPPKAQAIAAYKGLNIQAVQYVEVGKSNPRKRKQFRKDPLERLIVGDHLEAIHWYIEKTDHRGNRSDLNRMREMVR
jgi:glycosyltransferase involved in cell wall biosynthesis